MHHRGCAVVRCVQLQGGCGIGGPSTAQLGPGALLRWHAILLLCRFASVACRRLRLLKMYAATASPGRESARSPYVLAGAVLLWSLSVAHLACHSTCLASAKHDAVKPAYPDIYIYIGMMCQYYPRGISLTNHPEEWH